MREVPALARGLRILDLVAATPGLKIAEVSMQLGIPRSATYELISTLRAHRVIEQAADGGIVLGAKLFMLGSRFADSVDSDRLTSDAAAALRDTVDETVQVAVLDGRNVLYTAKAESSRQLRLVSTVGRMLPAHVTGIGKAMLAELPEGKFEALFDGVELETFTPTSIGTVPALRRELAATRKRGYAIDNSESTPDVSCVAAPIRGSAGDVVAAMSISVPLSRMSDGLREEYAELVVAAAADLSGQLGYFPHD
ncbi:IclR family transcriptional regulator [Microbacterium sp.]|uniref:IclR family transcriptional regulator n=1 Tax=Microbacterium sp. TaxID=51671 RepID=UPI003A88C31D